jgi:hypothetical protein
VCDGGVLAIVQNAAGSRRGPEFEKIKSDAIFLTELHVPGIDAGFAGAIGDQPAQRVISQARHPGDIAPESSQPNGGVKFSAADLHIQRLRLLEPAKVRRTEANHRFAESDDIVRHD